mmetsp:Transcript_44037/g.77768  ORF Transcript_44037/g.77768 Transcript_44037/m.77768 type:complete len:116 (-) Transcript_44037:147-494(-)
MQIQALLLSFIGMLVAAAAFQSPSHVSLSSKHSLSRRQQSALQAVSEVGSIDEFDKAVKEAAGDSLVIVDYSTTWCGPCKVIYPKYEEFSEQYTDAIFLKVVGDSSADASALMKR